MGVQVFAPDVVVIQLLQGFSLWVKRGPDPFPEIDLNADTGVAPKADRILNLRDVQDFVKSPASAMMG
jgi:hypothetical protein